MAVGIQDISHNCRIFLRVWGFFQADCGGREENYQPMATPLPHINIPPLILFFHTLSRFEQRRSSTDRLPHGTRATRHAVAANQGSRERWKKAVMEGRRRLFEPKHARWRRAWAWASRWRWRWRWRIGRRMTEREGLWGWERIRRSK